MMELLKYYKILALALLLGGLAWATAQSGSIKGLNGNTIVAFDQNIAADDLSGIETAAGSE